MTQITTGFPAVSLGLPYAVDDATPQADLGQVIAGENGRKYIYVKVGATALVTGSLYQAPAEDTADQDITPAATAVGATTLVTTSTMTVTANQYAGGYVVVTVTPGLANMYQIKSHAAFTAAAATFQLDDPIQVALTTTSRVDFIPNPFNGVVIAPTTLTSAVVGFAVNNVTAGNYGWLQIAGVGVVNNDAAGALTVGVALMPSSSVAGDVRLQTAGNHIVARALTGIASGECGAAIITLD
jgi:hypothetical protein